jgi:hypothetical protein
MLFVIWIGFFAFFGDIGCDIPSKVEPSYFENSVKIVDAG